MTIVKSTVHSVLGYDMPLVIATAVVLLAWPALAGPWERLWSPGPRTGDRLPWWPSLAAASLPVGMLILFLAPLQPSPQEIAQAATPAPSGSCSPTARWISAGGLQNYNVDTEYAQLALARSSQSATAAAEQGLDAAIRAALANPPPGAARTPYITSVSEFRTAARDLADGNIIAADTVSDDAYNSFNKAIDLVSAADNPIQDAAAGCGPGNSP
jgi:hypothetical protein